MRKWMFKLPQLVRGTARYRTGAVWYQSPSCLFSTIFHWQIGAHIGFSSLRFFLLKFSSHFDGMPCSAAKKSGFGGILWTGFSRSSLLLARRSWEDQDSAPNWISCPQPSTAYLSMSLENLLGRMDVRSFLHSSFCLHSSPNIVFEPYYVPGPVISEV